MKAFASALLLSGCALFTLAPPRPPEKPDLATYALISLTDDPLPYCGAVAISRSRLATAAHCVCMLDECVSVVYVSSHGAWFDAPSRPMLARVTSHRGDYAELEITSGTLPVWAELADDVPTQAVFVGHGKEPWHVASARIVSGTRRQLMVDMESRQGDSGGGLFTLEGKLLGVHSGRREGFAVVRRIER